MAVRAGHAESTVGGVPAGTAGAPSRARRLVGRRSRFLLGLVVAAFALRAVAAIALHEVSLARGGDGFLFADDRIYDRIAWQQTLAWRGDGPGVRPADSYLVNAYTRTQAAVYAVVGHRSLAMKLLNCLLGALTAGLVYLLARRLFGRPAADLAGVAAALFPSTFLWSLTTLKDTMFVFAAALLLWLLTELLATGRWRLVVPVLAAFALVGGLRFYVQALFGVLVPGAVLLQSGARLPRKWWLAATLAAGCAVLLWFSGGADLLDLSADRVNRQRGFAAIGAESSFATDEADAILAEATAAAQSAAPAPSQPTDQTEDRPLVSGSVRALAAWLPTGLAYTLAAPFPWAADRAVERAALPDVAAWYAAAALALLAIVHHRRAWRRWAHLVGFVGGVVVLLSLTSGNLGTLVRQRSMAVPFVLVFGGAGAAWLWEWWRARRPAPAPARADAGTARRATRR